MPPKARASEMMANPPFPLPTPRAAGAEGHLRRLRAPGRRRWDGTLCPAQTARTSAAPAQGRGQEVEMTLLFLPPAEPAFPGPERAVRQSQGGKRVPGPAPQHGAANPGTVSAGGGAAFLGIFCPISPPWFVGVLSQRGPPSAPASLRSSPLQPSQKLLLPKPSVSWSEQQ